MNQFAEKVLLYQYQGLQIGVEKLGRAQEQRWYELDEQDRLAPVIILGTEGSRSQEEGSYMGTLLVA